MQRIVARGCLCLTLMFSFITSAAAQAGAVNLGVGYQFLRTDEASSPLGLSVDVGAGLARHVTLVGEVGWSRDSALQFGFRDITTVLHGAVGARWVTSPWHSLKPFGQVLVGVERDTVEIERFGTDTASNTIVQPGVGLGLNLGAWWEVFGQVDLRRVFRDPRGVNTFRAVVGARIPLR